MQSQNSWLLLLVLIWWQPVQGQTTQPAASAGGASATFVGPVPQIFSPGVISGPANDGSPTFSPDGNTLYFTRSTAGWGVILESHKSHGEWSEPDVAPFSGEWSDSSPGPLAPRIFSATTTSICAWTRFPTTATPPRLMPSGWVFP